MIVIDGNPADELETCCWGANPDDSGTVTITTLSADRLAGSFELVLVPKAGSAASAPLVVTSGAFDIGREDP
ncbi:MAG TPA: hypothetical protein VK509_21995 [Polyangiales bacterium]|nr:hypothetical protein [Polyangiales bacterium]